MKITQGIRRCFFAASATFLISGIGKTQIIAPAAYSSGSKVNYVKTWDVLAPTQDPVAVMSKPNQDVRQTTQYIDGLGRPIQTVVRKGSLVTGDTARDLVMPVVYDDFGRETYKYLPFAANNTGGNTSMSDGLFKLNPFQQDSTFSKSLYSDETYFYAKSVFESSPANRVLETYAPGNNWVGTSGQSSESGRRGVKMKYWFNRTADSVRLWRVTSITNGLGSYSTNSIYGVGELSKQVIQDEHNNQVIQFKDKEGKIILKRVQLTTSADNGSGQTHTGWLCTYYIYDDASQLRCVIQPKGVELLAVSSWSLTSTILAELCFRYEYDSRGRMIMKKVPGAGIVYMVYDAKDRVVMSQDSLMRAAHQWLFTTYDDLNRPSSSGLITDNTNYNNAPYHWGQAEISTSYPNIGSYSNEILTKTFYDDYDWRSGEGNPLSNTRNTSYDSYLFSPSNSTWPYPQAMTQTIHLRGMVTGTKTKILGTGTYLYTVSFFDEKAKPVQVQATNISNGTDITTTQFGWEGQILFSVNKHEKGGTNSQTSIVLTKVTYDDLGRVTKTEKKISNTKVSSGSMPSSWTTISQHEYNSIGQLKKKKLGPEPLEILDYEYNIRGWILGANRNYAKNTSSVSNWFGFDLGYDKATIQPLGGSSIGSFTSQQYNGNITGMVWKSIGDNEIRKYDFTYDAANRFLSADFNQYTSSSFNKSAGIDFSVSNMAYDANGNILSMKQRGVKLTGSVTIDSLTYNYISNTNKLLNVIDGVNDALTKLGDFRTSLLHPNSGSKNSSTVDYNYDGNGNLLKDLNKNLISYTGVDGIEYNHLNLPKKITVKKDGSSNKGTIEYTYDAAGNKLKKVTTEGSAVTTTLYLIGNYINDTLQFIGTEEGRARFKKTNNTLHYDYFLKDHLGNVRMVLTSEKDTSTYPVVTFEDAAISNESIYYENVDIERTSRPGSFYTSGTNGTKVQLLRKSTQAIGSGKLLRVMAKDRVHIKVDYYIQNDATDNNNANGLNSLLSSLTSVINNNSGTGAFHGNGATVSSELGNSSPLASFLSPQGTGSSSSMPKAYLNILFFDEQFKFVDQNSEIIQVSTKGSGQQVVRMDGGAKQAPKNGFVYIYVSNESNNLVYFDNLQVVHERSSLVEESHYYPFGLTMAGICSKALGFGTPENKIKYNGKEEQKNEFSEGVGLEWLDYWARMYDNQIGRWMAIDPHTENYSNQSPYNYVMNMPMIATDPNGMDTYLSGQAAQDFFRQLQSSSNKSIDEIDDMAQSAMYQNGGESVENFTIDPQKFKTFDIKVDDKKIGVVYSYFDELKPDRELAGAAGGIRFMFGAVITDEGSKLNPTDLNWIQRLKTNYVTGRVPGQKPNEWFDDQSDESRSAGGRYYMTYEETQRRIANGQAPSFVRKDQYTSVMWDSPRRGIRDRETGEYINTTWMANLSLVNVNNNNSSLIIFMYGFSLTNGVLKVTKPTVIKQSN
jgi:RHS repeat-associated protein